MPDKSPSKKKLALLFLFITIACFLFFSVRPYAIIFFGIKKYFLAEKGFNELPKRHHNCFMKQFDGWPKQDLDAAAGSGNSAFGAPTFSAHMLQDESYCSENKDAVVKAGRAIYERHAKEIDGLLRNFDEIMALPVQKYDFSKPEEEPSEIDHAVGRVIDCFIVISHYFYNSGRNEDVVKLCLIIYKYSQIIANGDGYRPDLINCIKFGSRAKISIGNFIFWNALLNAEMSAPKYNGITALITAVDDDSLPFENYMNSSFDDSKRHARNFINISCAGLFKFERDIILKLAADKAASVKAESNRLFSIHGNRPREFTEKIDAYLMAVCSSNYDRGLVKQLFSNYGLVSDLAVSMSIPTVHKAYSNYYLTARLHAGSAAMMCKVLAKRQETKKWPASLTEAAIMTNGTVPVDIFNDKPLEPLVFKNDGGKILLYSTGPDGIDNGGDYKFRSSVEEKKDLLLFKINRL